MPKSIINIIKAITSLFIRISTKPILSNCVVACFQAHNYALHVLMALNSHKNKNIFHFYLNQWYQNQTSFWQAIKENDKSHKCHLFSHVTCFHRFHKHIIFHICSPLHSTHVCYSKKLQQELITCIAIIFWFWQPQ